MYLEIELNHILQLKKIKQVKHLFKTILITCVANGKLREEGILSRLFHVVFLQTHRNLSCIKHLPFIVLKRDVKLLLSVLFR